MNIVNDQSKANYSVGNEIMFRTEVLKSNVYDFNDAYIIVRENITVIGRNDAILSSIQKQCITKIDGRTIDESEDLDLVMPIHNLLEDSSSYSDSTDSLYFYSKDEATNLNNDIVNANNLKSYREALKLMKQWKLKKDNNCCAINRSK